MRPLLAAAAIAIAAAAPPPGGVTGAALVAAAGHATLKDIDYGSDHCDGATGIVPWLKALVGRDARAIEWTGGACRLVNDRNPIDAAGWPYCAQATISLVHPRDGDDTPMIEIYFEKPVGRHPGVAYAFRSLMMTRDDGPDYLRFRLDFEAEWRERFPAAAPRPCDD